jgi:uncharacterized membrane protein YhhN
MSVQPATWQINYGWGWLVAVICLILTILLTALGHMDVPVAVLIAAICSHRL